jgi:hypothetical protein
MTDTPDPDQIVLLHPSNLGHRLSRLAFAALPYHFLLCGISF